MTTLATFILSATPQRDRPVVQRWMEGAPVLGSEERCGEVYNPASGQVRTRVKLANSADVDAAVASAAAAFPAWRRKSGRGWTRRSLRWGRVPPPYFKS